MKLLLLLTLLIPQLAFSQGKKLDLDDLTIKGELLGDDRLLILSRQRTDMRNIIKFRENYRKEILEQLPQQKSKKKF
jgi:hypothetical protein